MASDPVAPERAHQMYPVLDPAQLTLARRFASGPERRFGAGETLYAVGEIRAPSWLVLQGEVKVSRRDGLAGEAIVTRYGPGQFSGEINQLAGRPSITAGHAGPSGCLAVPFDAAHLRALMVGSAELSEIFMRALILRRSDLIANAGAGTILIGDPQSGRLLRIQGFLDRNGFPMAVVDAARDIEGVAMIERLGVDTAELPLVVCPDGSLLRNPSETEVAACLGITPQLEQDARYDVAVVGAGPAGLATAVYAASEGLSVILIDERATGGQAGASARIENYLGFPTGISGQALTARAVHQALKFGADVAVPIRVEGLESSGNELVLHLGGGRRIRPRTVVIASGARYRRPDLPEFGAYEGSGVSYWASSIEARLCAGKRVALVGGGNSAGQAIAFLAPHVAELHVFVRRPLAETMSRYLIDRMAALANVVVHVGYEVAGMETDLLAGLSAARFRHNSDSSVIRVEVAHLFLFIGAEPNTDWLSGRVQTDDNGFIRTGPSGFGLESSFPGVFAIGDVRAGSTKRVAAAVGEGAAVVAQIHAKLAADRRARR